MSLHGTRTGATPGSAAERSGAARVVTPGAERRAATLVVRSDSADCTAHVLALSPGESTTLSLAPAGVTTVECHLDGADASAVLTFDPADGARAPVLSLRDSTVVVC
jgi:hypothetical protein